MIEVPCLHGVVYSYDRTTCRRCWAEGRAGVTVVVAVAVAIEVEVEGEVGGVVEGTVGVAFYKDTLSISA